jgi:hypothetical protein
MKMLMTYMHGYPCNRAWRPTEVCDVEDPTLSQQSAHMMAVKLSTLHAGHALPLEIFSGTHFCQRMSKP